MRKRSQGSRGHGERESTGQTEGWVRWEDGMKEEYVETEGGTEKWTK